jgi:protein gp37
LWQLISETPHLTWMLLTKRIGNVLLMLPADWPDSAFHNVWVGATVVNQEEAERDIPKLLRVPVAKRFLSCEPLLGPLDLTQFLDRGTEHMGHHEFPGIDWVIVGGESGTGARAMEIEWARSLRDQCAAAGVPFHFKQWGEWRGLERLGKAAAGHLLDGVEHRAFPA